MWEPQCPWKRWHFLAVDGYSGQSLVRSVPSSEIKEWRCCQELRVNIISSSTSESTEYIYPVHTGLWLMHMVQGSEVGEKNCFAHTYLQRHQSDSKPEQVSKCNAAPYSLTCTWNLWGIYHMYVVIKGEYIHLYKYQRLPFGVDIVRKRNIPCIFSHWKLFSSVSTRCLRWLALLLKHSPYSQHLWGLSPAWTLWYLMNLVRTLAQGIPTITTLI